MLPMRNVFATVKRHRHATLLSQTLCHEIYVETIIQKCIPLGCHKFIEIGGKQHNGSPYYWLQRHSFSTGFTSVHGESPSSEYAKLRKESLESEFGHALGANRSRSFSAAYRFGPFLALYRAAIILFHVLKLTIWQFFVQDIRKRAIKFRETLIRLGPFYIKLGQALSTRPDILPTEYCQELVKLQDQIPPFPTPVAIKSIESQLGVRVSDIFADISPQPVAAASLGQFAAHLHSGELVAVKVQRPGMSLSLTLDALLFHMIGGQLKRFAKARKDLLVAVNEMVRHMFDEIDYILEAKNAERFASLYASHPRDEKKDYPNATAGKTRRHKEANCIKVPKIYWDLTRRAVLTMEWIDGIKLTDEIGLKTAFLNRKELIDQGLYCSLRQLLEVGFFHADPHPGNLVATDSGALAYFDFGMMGDIPRHYRVGLIQMLVHFVNRDSLGLANDFLSLGFIPEGVDIQPVADAMKASFSDRSGQSQDFQVAAISEQASESVRESPNSEESSTPNPLRRKSFDMHAVVAATEDLLHFILSAKGQRVRVFLVRDIIGAADAFFQDEVVGNMFNDNPEARDTFDSEGRTMLVRVVNGFHYFSQAVKLAPEVWTAMLIRVAFTPEVHRFTLDIFSSLIIHFSGKIPETTFISLSRLMHKLVKNRS
ncbi:hypothetical protein ABKV19_018941 [Rosa sericea]